MLVSKIEGGAVANRPRLPHDLSSAPNMDNAKVRFFFDLRKDHKKKPPPAVKLETEKLTYETMKTNYSMFVMGVCMKVIWYSLPPSTTRTARTIASSPTEPAETTGTMTRLPDTVMFDCCAVPLFCCVVST